MVNNKVGSAGFEPATSSARGWHHTKLDYDPIIEMVLFYMRIILNHRYIFLFCGEISLILKSHIFTSFMQSMINFSLKWVLLISLSFFITPFSMSLKVNAKPIESAPVAPGEL